MQEPGDVSAKYFDRKSIRQAANKNPGESNELRRENKENIDMSSRFTAEKQ